MCKARAEWRLWEEREWRVRFHPTTMRKVPALAQFARHTLPHCTLGQTPMDPLPASSWSCRNSSSPWALETNFQVTMGVLYFPQPAGASVGEGELEGWEVSYPGGGILGCRGTMRVDGWCEQGVVCVCVCWHLAWLETVVINSAELHARREEREEQKGC